MECFIYKSPKRAETYLFVKREGEFDAVPEPLMRHFGQPLFVMRLDLTPDRKLARSDAGEVLEALEKQGFFLQLPPPDPAIR